MLFIHEIGYILFLVWMRVHLLQPKEVAGSSAPDLIAGAAYAEPSYKLGPPPDD